MNNGLEYLDTISLIDVHERLIHAAMQHKESPLYLHHETHVP